MRFMDAFTSTLAGETRIIGLLEEDCVLFDTPGNVICHPISPEVLLKIVRLQTLITLANEESQIPEATPFDTGLNDASRKVSNDGMLRTLMLHRAIVEVVRDEIPAELERFGVRYFVNSDKQLVWEEVIDITFI